MRSNFKLSHLLQKSTVAAATLCLAGFFRPIQAKESTQSNPFLCAPPMDKEEAATMVETLLRRDSSGYMDGDFPEHPRRILLRMDWKNMKLYRWVQYQTLPPEFTDAERALFKEQTILIDGTPTVVYEFEAGRTPAHEESINRTRKLMDIPAAEKSRRLRYKLPPSNETASILDTTDIAELLSQKRVLFYAGAGISATIVPTNLVVHRTLNYHPHVSFDPFIRILLNDPERVINSGFMVNFAKILHEHPEPTPAHHALSALAKLHNAAIVTTNSDPYLQLTGIKPISLWNDDFCTHWTEETAKKIDIVVIVGCSEDSLGFLGMYKHFNSQGIIVSFDIKAPKFLGSKDAVVLGSAQETLPKVLALSKEYNCDAHYTKGSAPRLNTSK